MNGSNYLTILRTTLQRVRDKEIPETVLSDSPIIHVVQQLVDEGYLQGISEGGSYSDIKITLEGIKYLQDYKSIFEQSMKSITPNPNEEYLVSIRCFVCGKIVKKEKEKLYCCQYCGRYKITKKAINFYKEQFKDNEHNKAKLGYAFYKLKRLDSSDKQSKLLTVTVSKLSEVLKLELPSPLDQANNLLRYVGKESKDFGADIDLGNKSQINSKRVQFTIGAHNLRSVLSAARLLVDEGALRSETSVSYSLTTKGWQRYDVLGSKTVFMAMDFNNPDVKAFREECVKKALDDEGYEMRVMDEYHKNGEITDHIRNELRRAQIVISDLTEGNNGAYWEAGFAEGSNKLVIYTCKETFFNDGKGVHFNTRGIKIILWEMDNFDITKEKIKATIKNSLANKF